VKNNVKNLAVFICICSVITLLLATTNFITAPIIEKNQTASANKSLMEVMPGGSGFEKMDVTGFKLPATVSEVYKETGGLGHVVKLVTAGYGTDMVLMCGVDAKGVVTGAVCLSSNETLSKEKTYGENFANKDAAGVDAVDTIAGATKTTEAYKNAVKDALNAAIILGGGSVDVRTEEEILKDNLDAALPAGEGTFVKLFLTEELSGIDSVYGAENEMGYVVVMGEQFIGVDAAGNVLTDGVDAAAVKAALTKLNNSTLTDIDLSAYPDLQSTIVSAKKTASGNYVIDAKGPGYGIKGGNEYHPASNEYIIVRVAVTPDYKIIDCLTVSQAETAGLGDACAEESFYGQFVGKTQENYTDIDAISGATLTTNGYKQAIERAFAAVAVLKGGAK